jgi:hypothetical protein
MRHAQKLNLSSWKETIFGTFAILLFLSINIFFPSNKNLIIWFFIETFTRAFFLLFLAPILFIKIVLKKNLREFGFNLQNKRKGFFFAFLALVFSLILSYILVRYTEFLKFYKWELPPSVFVSFRAFLLKDLLLFGIVSFIFEFFYKGFVLSVYSKKFLYGAIFIQAFPYLLPYLLVPGLSFYNYLPTILIVIIGGLVAYLTKSFLYSYFYGLTYTIIFDSLVIYWLKNGL